MIFKNSKIYDVLKYVSLIALPALAAFYFGLSKIWGLPYGGEIPATINLIAAFLGTLIGISSIKYSKQKE